MNWLSKQGKKLSEKILGIVDEMREMSEDAGECYDEAEEGKPEEKYWKAAMTYLEDTAYKLEDVASEMNGFSDDPAKERLWR